MSDCPHIGIVCGGNPLSQGTWSGTPAGLVHGLQDAGARVSVISTDLPQWLRVPLVAPARLRYRNATVANRQPVVTFVRSAAVNHRIAGTRNLDGVIALTTELYRIDPAVPWATFDDMTHLQALNSSFSELNWYPSKRTREWMERQADACRRATFCMATNPWAAESIRRDYGVPADRVHVVGLGARRQIDTSTARDWSTPRFLFVGQDWQRKNGEAVLKAFRDLRSTLPQAKLDVVGGHPPLAEPGVTGHGRLPLGDPEAQRQVDALFRSATCLVLPSHLEPSAVAHVEAGQAGIPSIGTTKGGVSELIGNGGLLVDPDDRQALLAAMRALSDPDTAQRLGQVAREHVSDLSWTRVGERILALFAEAKR